MKIIDTEQAEEKIIAKQKRRLKKKKPAMKLSGRSVRQLQRLIIKKGKSSNK